MSNRGGDGGQPSQEIRQGPIEIDYEVVALVVNYTIEKTMVDATGRVLEVTGRTNKVQRIKLHSLTPDKNMAILADEIIRNCNKIIHPSRVEELEQLLIKLQKHVVARGGDAATSGATSAATATGAEEGGRKGGRSAGGDEAKAEGKARASSNRRLEEKLGGGGNGMGGTVDRYAEFRAQHQQQVAQMQLSLPPASMEHLDEYLELLYQVPNAGGGGGGGRGGGARAEEGMREQIRGTAMLLQLCRDDVMNLEQLIQNNTVMGALTRVLQEEFKKSLELTFNILRIFLAFSNFVEMHELMSTYRIGLLTMKAIEFECVRIEHRETEAAERQAAYTAELKAAKINRNDLPENEVNSLVRSIKRNKDKEDFFHMVLARKQDKLLFVGLYILLNLAEEPAVEKKMVKKDIISQLNLMLSRKNADLLILTVTFLRKLSIIEENKETMKRLGVVGRLTKFIPCSSQALVNNVLRLLFNLSFDQELREQMVRAGLLPKLVKLLNTAACFRGKTLKLLYHLSVDDRCKSMFSFTSNSAAGGGGGNDIGGVSLVLGMIVNFPQEQLPKELAALAVNLTFNRHNCEAMIHNKAVSKMIERLTSLRNKDPLLLKILRNLALFTFNVQQELAASNNSLDYPFRGLWSPHVKALVICLIESDNHDTTVELLGILANMTMQDLPSTFGWHRFMKEYNLISLLTKLLIPGMSQNDVILEVVMITSAFAGDPEACGLIVASNLIQLLLSMWKEKGKHDMEILIQLIYCVYRLLQQDVSREETLYGNRVVVTYLMEALDHANGNVRKAADEVLELVIELDRKPNNELGTLSHAISKRRFEAYNNVWMSQISAMDAELGQYEPSNHSGTAESYNGDYSYNDADAGGVMYAAGGDGSYDHERYGEGGSYNHGTGGMVDDTLIEGQHSSSRRNSRDVVNGAAGGGGGGIRFYENSHGGVVSGMHGGADDISNSGNYDENEESGNSYDHGHGHGHGHGGGYGGGVAGGGHYANSNSRYK